MAVAREQARREVRAAETAAVRKVESIYIVYYGRMVVGGRPNGIIKYRVE